MSLPNSVKIEVQFKRHFEVCGRKSPPEFWWVEFKEGGATEGSDDVNPVANLKPCSLAV